MGVLYISGDIGGTNSRMELRRTGPKQTHADEKQRAEGDVLVAEHTYPSQKYPSMAAVVEQFLKEHKPAGESVYCMCLAVAGPVTNNVAAITNLPWPPIDGGELARLFKLERASIINDFEGIGYGLLALGPEDLESVYTPQGQTAQLPSTCAPKAVIGAGTGLGECYLTHTGVHYTVYACEGGHTDFAPRNQTEFDIMQHILRTTQFAPGSSQRIDRVSVERVCSGQGIPKIYEYLAQKRGGDANAKVAAALRAPDADVGRLIAEAAKARTCPLCIEAMDIFTRAYGAEAGNLALKVMPFGGIYIAGGIAGKNMQIIRKDDQFVKNYLDKGRMRAVLQRMPIYLIKHPQVGLLGSQVICRRIVYEALQGSGKQQIRAKL